MIKLKSQHFCSTLVESHYSLNFRLISMIKLRSDVQATDKWQHTAINAPLVMKQNLTLLYVVSNDTTLALSLGDVAVMTTLPASNPAAVISGAGPTTKSLHQMWDNPLGTRAFSSHVENK